MKKKLSLIPIIIAVVVCCYILFVPYNVTFHVLNVPSDLKNATIGVVDYNGEKGFGSYGYIDTDGKLTVKNIPFGTHEVRVSRSVYRYSAVGFNKNIDISIEPKTDLYQVNLTIKSSTGVPFAKLPIEIYLYNNEDHSIIGRFYPNNKSVEAGRTDKDGKCSFVLPAGRHELLLDYRGNKTQPLIIRYGKKKEYNIDLVYDRVDDVTIYPDYDD